MSTLVHTTAHFVTTLKSLFTRNEQLSLWSFGALMVLVIVGMGLVSLGVLNEKATKGYVLNKLESERQALVEDSEISEMLILRARAMAEIETAARSKGMYKPAREDVAFVLPMHVVAQK
jgi:hypothetical protein